MRDDDAEVATARWEVDATVEAATDLPNATNTFARRHGMSADARDAVKRAVSEAVEDAVARARDRQGRVTVDAATDGHWLSVQISSDALLAPGEALALPLVTSLAQRAEQTADAAGTNVLMEFDMPRAVRRAPRGVRPGLAYHRMSRRRGCAR